MDKPDKKDTEEKLTLNEETLDKLDHDIDTLRIQFEQYFMGARKRMPENDRTAIQYRLRRMSNIPTANYALKYQFQQLVAKFNAYNQYWNRIIQKIESGQISREKLKSLLDSGPEPEKEKEEKEKKQKPVDEKSELSSEKLDQVYRQLAEAKRQQNQELTITKEKLEQTLKKQMEALKEKYKDKKLEFDVVVEAGQTKIKAKVKK